jgi:hypothetical protein
MIMFSLPGHKEFRFIFGLVYLWLPYAAAALHHL